MRLAGAACGLLLVMSGCSLLPDHSLDYRQARDLPPLKLPEGQGKTRPVQPLYPVPEVRQGTRTVVLTGKDGRREKFIVPAPEPLVVSAPAVTAKGEGAGQPVLKPRLISDGNGYPLLQVDGDVDQIWDSLGSALARGKLGVEDRNQSLGVYYLKPLAGDGAPGSLQLKMTRTSGGCLLSLQMNEDTVADAAIARQLFDKLLENWPG